MGRLKVTGNSNLIFDISKKKIKDECPNLNLVQFGRLYIQNSIIFHNTQK